MTEHIDVVLTFDVDAETLWEARDPDSAAKPVWLSQGRYGPTVGLPRIMRLLARHGIPASFFVPGVVIERYPAEIGTIVEAGFDIGHHSHTHTWAQNLNKEQEREEFERAYRVIEEFTGRPPRGYRSPAAEFTPNTLDLMVEFGFEYSSNFFDGDSPYLLADTDIVEFPFSWHLDDAPFFLYSNKLPGRVMSAPSDVLETWTLEFDQLRQEPGRCLVVAMHPQVIGRPSRMWVLERFVEHVLAAGGARFSTFGELTDELRPRLLAERAK
ncbi:polysaccharide deacetylase family protein [Saccharopolyspora sp. 5N708]|uniref:polysaccharide deacetylase family protein n=1 Tax=Saccharopolyspora sp. 5N708 TaxID=3457424 RepID=UPI003FCFA643